jgi:hypothetical protein
MTDHAVSDGLAPSSAFVKTNGHQPTPAANAPHDRGASQRDLFPNEERLIWVDAGKGHKRLANPRELKRIRCRLTRERRKLKRDLRHLFKAPPRCSNVQLASRASVVKQLTLETIDEALDAVRVTAGAQVEAALDHAFGHRN